MSDKTTEIFEHLRYNLITKDRRFSEVNGKLCFEGVNVEELAKKYGSPVYVYSEPASRQKITQSPETK